MNAPARRAIVPDPFAEAAPTLAAAPPVELSKLSIALVKVNDSVESMNKMDADIATLEAKYPANTAFDLVTKAGHKEADGVRKNARQMRLDVKGMRKNGTDLLNGLKSELWAVADPRMETLQGIEDNAKNQLEAFDSVDATRVENHKKAIAAIKLMTEGAATMPAVDLMARRASLNAIKVDESYQEFQVEAQKAWDDAADILTEAQAQAEARERQAKELDDLRAAQAKGVERRARIAGIKNLPDGLVDTGKENIVAVLHGLQERDLAVEDFGDDLELAQLALNSAVVKIAGMLAELSLEDLSLEEAPAATGPIVATPEGDRAAPITRRSIPAARAAAPIEAPEESAVAADLYSGDLFVTMAENSVESPEGGLLANLPTKEDEFAGLGDGAPEAPPDLLKAAQDFITTVQESTALMPLEWLYAYEALDAAVNFHSEFAN